MAITVDCVVTPNGTIPSDNPDLFMLFHQLADMHEQGPALIEFLLDLRAPPPDRWFYRITAVDGREWKQFISWDGSPDSPQTFDANPPWRPSEYVRQRPIRNAALALIASFPALERIRYTFT